MGHALTPESKQLREFELSQLGPLGSGTTAGLPGQLGTYPNQQDFGQGIAHTAPFSLILHTL
jgi:hypothetical protein